MPENTNSRLLSIVILFLLATTLFNTLRINQFGDETTTFRKEARYQLARAKVALAEQQQINADLQRQIDALVAMQTAGAPVQ